MSDKPSTSGDESSSRTDEVEDLPPLPEQISQQLGGVRGLIEAGVPIAVFVILNVLLDDGLRIAILAAVGCAVAIAATRAAMRKPVRHAVNGLFGVGIGAVLAWRSGDANDFYLPGILYGLVYGVVLAGSAAVRHPFVGWGWSIIAGGGKKEWREDSKLVRVFGWLTLLWGVVFLLKNLFRLYLYWDGGYEDLLGWTTLALGYPVTAGLLAITLVAIRKVRPGMLLRSTAD